jgi:hypothetical protein
MRWSSVQYSKVQHRTVTPLDTLWCDPVTKCSHFFFAAISKSRTSFFTSARRSVKLQFIIIADMNRRDVFSRWSWKLEVLSVVLCFCVWDCSFFALDTELISAWACLSINLLLSGNAWAQKHHNCGTAGAGLNLKREQKGVEFTS